VAADPNHTAPVRAGEELDLARLGDFLRERLPEFAAALEVEQFPSGHSNLTYLVRSGTGELVLRRPPFGTKVKSAHDMGREYRVLSRLSKVYPKAPRPLLYCEDPAVVGAPFYLMERLRGIVIRKDLPPELAAAPETLRRLSESFIENLALLHGLEVRSCGLDDLGKPEGYVARQIEGWTRRWQDAQTEAVPGIDQLAAWLAGHAPPESGASLIHNDYKLDNLLLDPEDPTRIVGVLDWEMATLGDPLMDFGTTLSYWVEPGDPPEFLALRFAPTARPGFLSRAQLVEHYARASGRDLSNVLYYYVYGLFKVAVVVQQIYYRWVHGLTRDERFSILGETAKALGRQAAEAVEAGSIAPP